MRQHAHIDFQLFSQKSSGIPALPLGGQERRDSQRRSITNHWPSSNTLNSSTLSINMTSCAATMVLLPRPASTGSTSFGSSWMSASSTPLHCIWKLQVDQGSSSCHTWIFTWMWSKDWWEVTVAASEPASSNLHSHQHQSSPGPFEDAGKAGQRQRKRKTSSGHSQICGRTTTSVERTVSEKSIKTDSTEKGGNEQKAQKETSLEERRCQSYKSR